MADEGANAGEVFRRSTMNRIASADELDHYIKVTNPSAWVVTIAALLLIAGVIIWAVVAIVPVTVETTGIHYRDSSSGENVVLCWVDKSTAEMLSSIASGHIAIIKKGSNEDSIHGRNRRDRSNRTQAPRSNSS